MASKTDIIESLLFASDKPVTLKKLAQIVELTTDETMAELDALRVEKESIGSIQLIEVAGGWQLATKPQFSTYIRQLRDAPRQRLSRAAFEVLAVVAYRQPVTRSEIESLRGVDCSGPVQFLLEKKLLEFAGRKDAPGRPHLYATTAEFLDHFGLRDLSDLPTLEELAELNGGALALGEIHDGDSLFNRGTMKTEEEFEEMQAEEVSRQEAVAGGSGDEAAAAVADEPGDAETAADEPVEPVADGPVASEVTDSTGPEEAVAEDAASDGPVAEAAVVEEGAADEPASDDLAAEEPVAEEPATDEPVSDEAVADEAVADEAVADEAVGEEGAADVPGADEPIVEEPVADDPSANEAVTDGAVRDEVVADDAVAAEVEAAGSGEDVPEAGESPVAGSAQGIERESAEAELVEAEPVEAEELASGAVVDASDDGEVRVLLPPDMWSEDEKVTA